MSADNIKTPEISKYFFQPNGSIEIPPPGAIINGIKIKGIRRISYTSTPLSAADAAKAKAKRAAKRRRFEYLMSEHTPTKSPLATTEPITILSDEDDDKEIDDLIDDMEESFSVTPLKARAPLIEVEDLDDDEDEDDDEEENLGMPPPPVRPQGKKFVFLEDKDELKFVCSKLDKRPNEEYLVKKTWSQEDIDDFLGNRLDFTPDEIAKIIGLSKEIIRLVTRIFADYKLFQSSIVDRKEFVWQNAFDYRALKAKIDELYKVEKRPRQHVVMFLVPGSKPKFIASDLPCWMALDQKRVAAHLQFCPPNRPIKRVLYWVNQTSEITEPLRTFGDQRPCDISSIEPPIERCDQITTAFVSRYWKLEQLFSIPDLF